MLLPTTETRPAGDAIDALLPLDAANIVLDGQQAAIEAVRRAAPQIAEGADAMAAAIRAGHSLVYGAAGSSGLMALADACELPGTFGIPATRIQIHMAGGIPVDGRMPGDTEDDEAAAINAMRNIGQGDVVLALSASGTTPYATQLATSARDAGATVIGVANNAGTPLLDLSDVPICLETPPEVIAGSTRMGAGTAQKAALNLMSSMMGVRLGHVYQGMMVNVVADNAKLIKRATRMVSDIADVPVGAAEAALNEANGHIKTAILVARGHSVAAAHALLATHEGHLGPCLHTPTPNN